MSPLGPAALHATKEVPNPAAGLWYGSAAGLMEGARACIDAARVCVAFDEPAPDRGAARPLDAEQGIMANRFCYSYATRPALVLLLALLGTRVRGVKAVGS